jgi:hypothetical protein
MSMDNHGAMISTGENWFVYQRPLVILLAGTSTSKAGEISEENYEFAVTKYLCSYKEFVTCCKILRHGSDGFTFPPKEGVLRIFIALKNPFPPAGYEPSSLRSNGKS